MVQFLVQLDEATAKELEKVAPAASRQRSRFIRLAIQAALMRVQDSQTREAYLRDGDDEPAYFNPRVWDDWNPTRKKRRKKPTK